MLYLSEASLNILRAVSRLLWGQPLTQKREGIDGITSAQTNEDQYFSLSVNCETLDLVLFDSEVCTGVISSAWTAEVSLDFFLTFLFCL